MIIENLRRRGYRDIVSPFCNNYKMGNQLLILVLLKHNNILDYR